MFQTVTLQHFQVMIDKGFVLSEDQPGHEIVLLRRHEKNNKLVIKVYTSIPKGQTQCRDVGADAIRVALVCEPGTAPGRGYGVGKSKRVNRTGAPTDVVGRVLDRARELWKLGCTRG